MSAPMRRGWCPSALRPMLTGDGLLVRLRPLGGVLSLARAEVIVACAVTCGNGHLDLTSRANLQIRGVRDETMPELVERLRAAGLVGADEEAALDVVSSPLAGIDPSERIDVRSMVAALAERAVHDPVLRALPAKFGFVVDGGGELGLAGVAADVRFAALGAGEIEVQVADVSVGVCASDAVPDVAALLAARFLEVRGEDHRMRQVVERLGPQPFLANAGRAPLLPRSGRRWPDEVGSDEGGATRRHFSAAEALDSGLHDRPHPTLADARATFSRAAGEGARVLGVCSNYLGVAFPFGRLEATDLTTLARGAGVLGGADIRLTPWRAVLVTGLAPPAAGSLAAGLDPTRFILDSGDPRLAVAACPGAPACASGSTDTRADATALAAFAPRPADGHIALHVSGCAKGCAHAAAAPITLVAEAGRYALVRNGNAQSPPDATGLTLAGAAAMLAQMSAEGGAA